MALLKLSILFFTSDQAKLGSEGNLMCYTLVSSSGNLHGGVGFSSAPAAALQRSTYTYYSVPTLGLQAPKPWCHLPWDSLHGSPRAAHLPKVRADRLLAAADPSFRIFAYVGYCCVWGNLPGVPISRCF